MYARGAAALGALGAVTAISVAGCDNVGSLGGCAPEFAEGTDPATCTAKRCNRGIVTTDLGTGAQRLFCTAACNPDAGTGCALDEVCYVEPGGPTGDAFCALKCGDARCKAPLVCLAGGAACY